MSTLVLIRHGQSAYNLENRFTGLEDVDLSPMGIDEAKATGLLLKKYKFDFAYTSFLKRAIHTLEIILEEIGEKIPIFKCVALNERDYGELQGLNKTETEKKYGASQVLLWRRSYLIAPPGGESLKNTYDRVIPYYKSEIESKLKENKTILIVAHGNSLRALVMYLENFSEISISNLEIKTGALRVYQFDKNMKVTTEIF